MNEFTFYIPSGVAAMDFAKKAMLRLGLRITQEPGPDVTHLLLSVPSFQSGGLLRGGTDLQNILKQLPTDITVLGGNLNHPALAGYRTVDLLQDAQYLAENAAITAYCAIKVASDHMTRTWEHCPVLIIGWGRIGKCLGRLLRALGADVTVAARKENDRAMLQALGYHATEKPEDLHLFKVIFSTAPAQVISAEQAAVCAQDCVKIDLASSLGIGGGGVIWARGLPGIHAPESSGELIAHTVLRLTALGGEQL